MPRPVESISRMDVRVRKVEESVKQLDAQMLLVKIEQQEIIAEHSRKIAEQVIKQNLQIAEQHQNLIIQKAAARRTQAFQTVAIVLLAVCSALAFWF